MDSERKNTLFEIIDAGRKVIKGLTTKVSAEVKEITTPEEIYEILPEASVDMLNQLKARSMQLALQHARTNPHL